MAFKTSLAVKRDEILAAKGRYEVGLEKLAFATESVNAMQVRYRAPGGYNDRKEPRIARGIKPLSMPALVYDSRTLPGKRCHSSFLVIVHELQ